MKRTVWLMLLALGCGPPSLTLGESSESETASMADGDGDPGDGDGDGDTTGDGDGDGDTTGDGDGDTTGDGDGDGDGDTTGDGDGEADCNTYDPMMCEPPGQVISFFDAVGVPGDYCMCPCRVGTDCPMGPPGTQSACAVVLDMPEPPDPTGCALICDPEMMDMCPLGSTCKLLPDQPPEQPVGVCTYP
jgi:hypothetical protein